MIRWSRVPAAGAIALALLSSLFSSPPVRGDEPAAADAPERSYSIGGTVKLLDVGKSRLEVIVGVGYVLRIVKMRLSERCSASAEGRRIPLETIQPGDIVRVQGEIESGEQAAPAGLTATMIELVMAVPGRVTKSSAGSGTSAFRTGGNRWLNGEV